QHHQAALQAAQARDVHPVAAAPARLAGLRLAVLRRGRLREAQRLRIGPPLRRPEPPAPQYREPEPREPRRRSRNRMYIPGLGCLKGCLMVLLILAIAAVALWNFTPLPHWWENVQTWWGEAQTWLSSFSGSSH
ncbi:hypothetical protein ACFPZF_24425, partial [Kitasatospora cinereorecta]